ncbi:YEATS-associated helix-containing protein [Thiobacter aerophilum]|uniref:YEATS-associated helix-containing protein n=1 Tax=Thiobacter aerophilum TaxID=3121275 RepID=A0ABV0EIM6_9BURK
METPSAALFDPYMMTVLIIMVSAGILAGLANFFLAEGASNRELAKYVVLGVVAALTVPLFLNMTSSNLLEFGRTRPLAVFVFAGFCLLYVLLSRRVFEAVANRLLARAGRTAVERASVSLASVEDFFRAGFTASDVEILRAVAQGGSIYDNLSERMANPPAKDFVNERLARLRQSGLVELSTDEQNLVHLCLSPRGAQLLAEVSAGGHA